MAVREGIRPLSHPSTVRLETPSFLANAARERPSRQRLLMISSGVTGARVVEFLLPCQESLRYLRNHAETLDVLPLPFRSRSDRRKTNWNRKRRTRPGGDPGRAQLEAEYVQAYAGHPVADNKQAFHPHGLADGPSQKQPVPGQEGGLPRDRFDPSGVQAEHAGLADVRAAHDRRRVL
jgi:hypothetical protein